MCATLVGVVLLGTIVAAPSAVARADCSVSSYAIADAAWQRRTRESALLEAGELAANGRWSDARGVYLWVLAREKEDPEALVGLARVDAWGGCWAISESEFRRALAASPDDADVRAGYVDLLVWSGRSDEAQRVLAAGARGGAPGDPPKSPPLLVRAAQFAFWRGDATTAVRLADEAERGAPDDADVRAMRDRMFRGEARLTMRVDAYPGNPVMTLGGQVLQRVGLVEIAVGAQLIARFSDAGNIYDGRYPLDLAYHPAIGVTLGVEIAPGAPSQAIPDFTGKVWATVPLFGPVDASFSYNLWHFAGDEVLHIFNPSVGVALPKEVRLEGRAWISYATLPNTMNAAEGAGGLQVSWTPTSRFSGGITYTYGAVADAVALALAMSGTLNQFLEFRSHVAGAYVDWLIDRKVGIRPVVGLERREDPADNVAWIGSAQADVYARW